MKKVFEKILECDDIEVIKNCVRIIAENEELGMNDSVMLVNLKQLQGEVDSCHYDEDMAKLHLCLIKSIHAIDIAKDYWSKVEGKNINVWDWCVLWGEMDRQNGDKIRKWFPNSKGISYEEKVFDECLSFLDNGKLPYYDLNV